MSAQHPEGTSGGRVVVDCFVRTDAISDPVEARVESLRALASDGIVDTLSVETWPAEVVLTPLTEGTSPVERFRTFERWAAQWGADIEPAFRRVTRRSDMTGETREVLRTPALCLAVRVDGRLREVFPHRSKDTTYTVGDAIEALESGLVAVDESVEDPTSSPDNCPDCDVPLATGQGLYACPDCGWAAVATGDGALQPVEVEPAERPRADAGPSAPRP